MYDIYINDEYAGIVYADSSLEAEEIAPVYYSIFPQDNVEALPR